MNVNDAAVAVGIERLLDAGDRARGEEREQARGVEWCAGIEPQRDVGARRQRCGASRDGELPIRARNSALNRRTLPNPAANAMSVSGSAVSCSSCLASASRRVCASSTGDTPSRADTARCAGGAR